jgi:hypothetical protein
LAEGQDGKCAAARSPASADVIVIDTEAAETPRERYADRFYLAAEIVSSSERTYIESKREIYKLHDACKYILTIQQDRVDIRIDWRTEAGWNEELLRGLGDPFVLADFGLRCKVGIFIEGPCWRRAKPRVIEFDLGNLIISSSARALGSVSICNYSFRSN